MSTTTDVDELAQAVKNLKQQGIHPKISSAPAVAKLSPTDSVDTIAETIERLAPEDRAALAELVDRYAAGADDEVERYKQALVGGQPTGQEPERQEKTADASADAEEPADEVAAFKASLVGGSPDAHREKATGGEGTGAASGPSDEAKEAFKAALVGGGQTTGHERRRKEAAREDMTLEEQKQAFLGAGDPREDEAERDVDEATAKFLRGAARRAD